MEDMRHKITRRDIIEANRAYAPYAIREPPGSYIPVVRGGEGREDWPRPDPIHWRSLVRGAAEVLLASGVLVLAAWKLADLVVLLLR